MSKRRIIVEMGTGNDLYGGDYTKAACRAVQDALHHSSLTLFKSLGIDHGQMDVRVTIGVAEPGKVDQARVAQTLPRGHATVTVVEGGLDVEDPNSGQPHVIATAAVEAYLDLNAKDWTIKTD